MPCTYFESDAERRASSERVRKRHQDELDKLTAEADMLRESLIRILDSHPSVAHLVHPKVQQTLYENQTEHRKMDLARLEATFTKRKDAARLAKVWAADPSKPLEPQLGFDPDEF